MNHEVKLDKYDAMSAEELTESVDAGLHAGAYALAQAGMALREIQRRGEYPTTFETFVKEKFGLTRSRAYQFMYAADIITDLASAFDANKLPRSESAVRPMIALTKEQRIEVWQRALGGTRKSPGYGAVKAIVDEVLAS